MEPDLIPYRASPGIVARTVLILAPHADDEIFGCGGAAALHVLAGAAVHIVVLTADADADTAAVREAESRIAAAVIGQRSPEFWNVSDRGLVAGAALVHRLQERLVDIGADLVYAPSPYEIHPDHRQASEIATRAVAGIGGPLRLAFYEIGNPLRPNVLVDITPVLARKRRAMRSFASQLARQDYLRHIGALNEFRSYTLPPEVKAAEAFWMVDAGEIAGGLVTRHRLPIVSAGLGPASHEDASGDWPLVSVLVRSMDRPWLAQALDSVALQTYPRIEVVVVASASDHGALPPWCGPFPMRLVADGQPLARSAAANRALQAARGDLLMFLDDDDWLLPGHVGRLAGVLRTLPHARIAYSGVDLVDVEGQPQGQTLDLPWDRVRHMAGNLMPIHAVLFDARLVREEGCRFDEDLDRYEDWDFWLQIARHASPIHVPGSSAVYRVHRSSGVHENAGPRSDAAGRVYDKWESLWSEAERGALMERVWALPDAEAACAQAQEYAAQLESDAARLRAYTEELEIGRDRQLRRLHAEIDRLQSALGAIDAAYAKSHASGVAAVHATTAQALHDKDVHIQNLEGDTAHLRALVHAKDVHIGNLEAIGSALRAMPFVRLQTGMRGLRSRIGRAFKNFGRHGPASIPDASVRATASVEEEPAIEPAVDSAPQASVMPEAAAGSTSDYAAWAMRHDTLSAADLAALRDESTQWSSRPLISVVMPVYNPPLDLLREAVASVQQQAYDRWELCIADDASTDDAVWTLLQVLSEQDRRIRATRRAVNGHISEASNSALALATGEFIALLDNDDILPPDALFRIAQALHARPTAKIFYSDEDKLDAAGRRFGPYFKPDWNYTLFLGHNLISHLGVYRRDLMVEVGGFRKGIEGSQDYDLALRCIEHIDDPADIVHIPRVLYHWRAIEGSTALATEAKPYAMHAAQQALEEHLERTGRGGSVETLDTSNYRTTPPDRPACDDVSLVLFGDVLPGIPAWSADPAYGIRDIQCCAAHPDAVAAGIAQAKGSLIALVSDRARPMDVRALRDLSRFAAGRGVAAAAGTLRDPDGLLVRGALVLSPDDGLFVAHRGLPRGHAGYMGRAMLAQEMSALGPDCIVLSREALDSVGPLQKGFDSLLLCVLDWNLRAGRRGWRNVWLPAAEWKISRAAADTLDRSLADDVVVFLNGKASIPDVRHHHHDPAHHPYLDAAPGDFVLRLPAKP